MLSPDAEVDPVKVLAEATPSSGSQGPAHDPAVGALTKAYNKLTGKTSKSADDQCQ